jgi:hypothetical protein
MQVIKLYLPMKDNDGDDLMHIHNNFIDKIAYHNKSRINDNKESEITGFTRYQAEGFWFDSHEIYKDDIKIYEFHVSNKNVGIAYTLLQRHAVTLCRRMKQKCIYLQLNNDTELVKSVDND